MQPFLLPRHCIAVELAKLVLPSDQGNLADNVRRRSAAELWRFEAGWDIGFADAGAFFGMRATGAFDTVGVKGAKIGAGIGGDKIGNVDLWVRKRVLDSGMVGDSVWMFERGLREGVLAFYEAVGV